MDAKWITAGQKNHTDCPVFEKIFNIKGRISSAVMNVSAKGVYVAEINGNRVGSFIMAPGWTEYRERIQYQSYDVTALLKEENTVHITLANGWYSGRIATGEGNWHKGDPEYLMRTEEVIAEIIIEYADVSRAHISTGTDWFTSFGALEFCDIYDGEIYDANTVPEFTRHAILAADQSTGMLVPQQGEEVTEHERIKPTALIISPKGERILDFGQNITGYPEITLNAAKGAQVSFSFAEILDKDGNFYNENYRSAKCFFKYTCKEGLQTHKPTHTFYGFRYIRIDEYPDIPIELENFTAITVHSNIKRTGWIETSDEMVNRLFGNIIRGQESNYLDIPTDCPQRDERMGWTGDAQVFVRTASFNFNVQKFFLKWLTDMKLDQREDGAVPAVIPRLFESSAGSAGWSDAITVCPWEIYLTYGNREILSIMYPSMKKWVDYITAVTTTKGLWTGHEHFGDWLELSGIYDKSSVSTRKDVIAAGYYAYSTQIVSKVGRILGENTEKYEKLYGEIKKAFIEAYQDNLCTQTEFVIALYFGLTDAPAKLAKKLAEKIRADGTMIQTGFLGTPYILHVLTENGYNELAYELLLRKDYPSWLYPITKGATTMWEHWDGIKPDGSVWSAEMNSYNHYGYGAVADWLYGKCAGINRVEDAPGFKKILFKPYPSDKIDRLFAKIETEYGTVISGWYHKNGHIVYEITTPVPATAVIDGKTTDIPIGKTVFG